MIQSNIVYTEAYIVLEKHNLLKKLPNNIFKIIKENYDNSINFKYVDDLPLEYQPLSKETRVFLTDLYIKYISKSDDEINQLKAIIAENTKQMEIKKKAIYNPNDLFINQKKYVRSNEQEKLDENMKEISLVEYKENFFIKFKNFILKLLHIKS